MFGTVNGIREIVKENAIYRRERTVNLGIFPYLLSKVIVLGVISLIQSAELLLIIEIFEPLHQGVFLPVLLEAYIAVALAGLAGMMIGLAASAFSYDISNQATGKIVVALPEGYDVSHKKLALILIL